MQKLQKFTLIERAVRQTVCPACPDRPPGSEDLGADVPRACQAHCTIFLSLPALYNISRQTAGDPTASYELLMRNLICQKCQAVPTAGDYCADGFARSCPLSRHGRDALVAIERVSEVVSGRR
jgi:hypothetical protein